MDTPALTYPLLETHPQLPELVLGFSQTLAETLLQTLRAFQVQRPALLTNH